MEDLVVGEDRVQCDTEQEVLQSNPAALHKVWVHVVSRQLVPHKLSLHTNTSAIPALSVSVLQRMNEPGSGLNSLASQAVEEQQCMDR